MPRPTQLSVDNVLRFLQLTSTPPSAQEIASGLKLRKVDQRALFKMLSRLKKRGSIEELPGGRYQLPGKRKGHLADAPAASSSLARPSAAPRADEISARLVLHHDGYGFAVPDQPIPTLDGDVFIPRDAIGDAMHGDRVLVKMLRSRPTAGGQRVEGRILRILDRAHATVVGLFRYASRGAIVLPYDTRFQHEIEIPPGEEATSQLRQKYGLPEPGASPHRRLPRMPELDGAVVNVQLIRFPRQGAAATGRILEILGRPGDLGVDTEIIIRKHHLPHEFAPEVLAEAERQAHQVTDLERVGREDFRHLPIVTIDGETARDFDDAVYVERHPNGWHLQVHIADVAHYVRVASKLDQEARLRGTSVYFPSRAVPMLPEALSNNICSLRPREDRLVMSVLMDFDARGEIRSSRFASGMIRSAERMTYTNVNRVLEGEPGTTAQYAYLAPHFHNMKDLALLLNARRNEHGSIDFDLPEPVIEFDEQLRMISVSRSERNIAHRLIEEFMLAANRAVASHLLQRGLESLHRVHEKPDPRKVLEFEELARAFGYSLGVENLHQREIAVRHGRVPAPAKAGRPDSYGHGRERSMRVALPAEDIRITPQHYQRLIRKVAGKPEERILSYLMLRSLKQARYAAEPLGHFALGFQEYTHFTSPIRRYPDLIVHRILKWALANPQGSPPKSTPASSTRANVGAPLHRAQPAPASKVSTSLAPPGSEPALYSHAQLEEIGVESSEDERRAALAERELMDWKRAQFMEQHLGEEYDGLITSVQKFGCFVELLDVFVEGLLPVSALEEASDARVVYRESDHAMVALLGSGTQRGRGTRRGVKPPELAWHLGDRIRVRAERIDPMRKRVEFALAEPQPSQ
ncbi:MAG TPA: RNB domain-containing ribonuclease [Candidatus Acidoferrales bacterium]|nr:RNB domain-containing ribonuclease [Candidatus Acidoferrales bacterium]